MRYLALAGIWLIILACGLAAQTADPNGPEENSKTETRSRPGPRHRTLRHSMVPSSEHSDTRSTHKPERTMTLDVRGLDIDHVLKLIGDVAGLTIVKDPAITGPITIIAPRPVTIDEALEILNAALQARGFTSIRSGQVLKVITQERASQLTTETHFGRDPESILPGDRIITQIVPLASLDAGEVTNQLNPLAMNPSSIIPNITSNTLYITDTASNVRRFLEIINEMEALNSEGLRIFQLQYVGAEEMSALLVEIFGGMSTTGITAPYDRRLLPTRGSSRPRTSPQSRAIMASSTGMPGGQIIPDARTNSIVVLSSPDRLKLIEQFISEFDKPVDYSSTIAVIPLQHARADAVADLLNQTFSGSSVSRQAIVAAPSTARTSPSVSGTRSTGNAETNGESGPILAAGDSSAGWGVLTQTDSFASVGRTVEGRVVPLVEATDIVVIADPSTNSLIVNASPEKLELVKAMVKSLDIVPAQVLIQAIIAEVNITKQTQLGLEFTSIANNIFGSDAQGTVMQNYGLQQTDSEGTPIPLSGLSWSVINPDRFEAFVNALGTDSNVRILSTPKIFTTSGKSAKIDISQLVPFATGQFVSDTGGVSTTVNYESVGIVLEVTPIISQDGWVSMEVSQSTDDLLRFENLTPTLRLPVVSRRLTEGSVFVQDCYTLVLGGLMSDRETSSVSGIPILKDLPLFGWLFSSKDTKKEKSELLVFLTPQVVTTSEESELITAQQMKMMKSLPKLPEVSYTE